MDQVGRLLVELATDEEFFAPLIAAMPAGAPAVHYTTQSRGRGTGWRPVTRAGPTADRSVAYGAVPRAGSKSSTWVRRMLLPDGSRNEVSMP
jgi:hypothetical protein